MVFNDYKDLINYISILTSAFVYCFYIAHNKYTPNCIKKMQRSCIIRCNSSLCKKIANTRGKSYLLDDPKEWPNESLETCLYTWWNLIHLLFYGALTYAYPQYAVHSMLISIIYELYEYIYYKCQDFIFDLLSNLIGISLGYYIARF